MNPSPPKKLVRLLIHTNDGMEWIMRQLINTRDILHDTDEICICYTGDAPVVAAVMSKPVFLGTLYSFAADVLVQDDLHFIFKKANRPSAVSFRC